MFCCVPRCSFSHVSKKYFDSSISLHEFPSDPNIAAKWIRNINISMPNGGTWFPKPEDKVCSSHFVPNDFKQNTVRRVLKPGSVPTVFEHIPSTNSNTLAASRNGEKRKKNSPRSPLIVKVIKPADSDELENDSVKSPISSPCKKFIALPSPVVPSLFQATPASISISNVTSLASPQKLVSLLNSDKINEEQTIATISQSLNPTVATNTISMAAGTQTTLTAYQPQNATAATKAVGEQTCTVAPQSQNRTAVTDGKRRERLRETPSSAEQKLQQYLNKLKKYKNRSQQPSMDLIEIGPSTFLKINPDVIKVTKKVTPTGNTVLQFVMNPNLAGIDAKNAFQLGSNSSVAKPVTSRHTVRNKTDGKILQQEVSVSSSGNTLQSLKSNEVKNNGPKEPNVTHTDISNKENDSMIPDTTSQNDDIQIIPVNDPPVRLTTNSPVNNSVPFLALKQERYRKALRTKNRAMHTLRTKIDKLVKKVEELENRCIVQERQLNFPCLKKLKVIKKNAENGEPHANFILEQIRGYFPNILLRWSPTTMNQCSAWCRKAPYAYEYFKKADLFRLPALATVKRYIKKHPEITTQIKNRTLGIRTFDSDDSSSDFDFDESGEDNVPNGDLSLVDSTDVPCETVLDEPGPNATTLECRMVTFPNVETNCMTPNAQQGNKILPMTVDSSEKGGSENSGTALLPDIARDTESNITEATENMQSLVAVVSDELEMTNNSRAKPLDNDEIVPNSTEVTDLPPSSVEDGITSLSVGGQELILQPGNVIRLNSEFGDSQDFSSQYIVIPAADDQVVSGDHQYSIGQPVSFVLQNADEPNQVLYITNNPAVSETVTTVNLAN